MAKSSGALAQSDRVKTDEKAEKIRRVAAATLNIIWQGGIRSLSPTRVARAAKVSRPWIYKYIGGSKEALMQSAVDFFGRLYAHIDRQESNDLDVKSWMKLEMQDLKRNFELSEQCPWILPIYYHYKGSKNVLGIGIEKVESEYLRKKSQVIKKIVGTSDSSSRIIAELMMTYKLATVHRWQVGQLKKTISEEELTARLEKLLEFVANIKNQKA